MEGTDNKINEEAKEVDQELKMREQQQNTDEANKAINNDAMIFYCEHDKGCEGKFDTLKQYFKHHHYFFKFWREEKKYLKNRIRLLKSKTFISLHNLLNSEFKFHIINLEMCEDNKKEIRRLKTEKEELEQRNNYYNSLLNS